MKLQRKWNSVQEVRPFEFVLLVDQQQFVCVVIVGFSVARIRLRVV